MKHNPRVLTAACEPLPAWDPAVYLADFAFQVLFPLAADHAQQGVAGTMAGRAFTTGQPVTSERDGSVRVWVPVVEQTTRTGVLAVTVPEASSQVLAQVESLGVFAGLVVAAAMRVSADDRAALAEAAGPDGIHVIIDYLWGQPTEAAIAAITRRGMTHTVPRVRLVEVGMMAGPTISLPADVLRSSGPEILGSGPGTIPLAEITGTIPEFMSLAAVGDLPIEIDEVLLAEVEPTWHRRSSGRRLVFRP